MVKRSKLKSMPVAMCGKHKWLGFYASHLEHVSISENKGCPGTSHLILCTKTLRPMFHCPAVGQGLRTLNSKLGRPLNPWFPHRTVCLQTLCLWEAASSLQNSDRTVMTGKTERKCYLFPLQFHTLGHYCGACIQQIFMERPLYVERCAGCWGVHRMRHSEVYLYSRGADIINKQIHTNQIILNSGNCWDGTRIMWPIVTQ